VEASEAFEIALGGFAAQFTSERGDIFFGKQRRLLGPHTWAKCETCGEHNRNDWLHEDLPERIAFYIVRDCDAGQAFREFRAGNSAIFWGGGT